MIATRRAAQLGKRLQRMQERLRLVLARKLRTFFRQQARRVVRRYLDQHKSVIGGVAWLSEHTMLATLERKAVAEDLLPSEEERLLQIVLESVLAQMITQASGVAADLAGVSGLVDDDPTMRALLKEAGMRVKGITDETRDAIRRVLVDGTDRGYTPYQLANGVAKDGFRGLRAVVQETYKGRADTIARTEIALTASAATAERYQAARVAKVEILDGVGCGWNGHDDSDKANGSVRTVAAFQAQPISHPNCVRVALPVLESRR